MRKWPNIIILVLGITASCISCLTKTYDIGLDNFEPHLAVKCFFTEGEPFSIVVTSARSYTDSLNTLDTIKNAEVLIYENGVFMESLEWQESNRREDGTLYRGVGIYKSAHTQPVAGKTYQIAVSAPGFDQVYAESTIPERTNLSYLRHEYITEEKDGISYQYLKVFLRMQNPDRLGHFFFFVTLREYWSDVDDPYWPMIDDPVLGSTFERDQDGLEYNYVLFSNELIEEDHYDFLVKFWQPDTTNMYGRPRSFYHLATLSEDAYQYFRTLTQYRELDPRFSEPIWIYSNVEGGAGVFAGINISTDSLIFTGTPVTY